MLGRTFAARPLLRVSDSADLGHDTEREVQELPRNVAHNEAPAIRGDAGGEDEAGIDEADATTPFSPPSDPAQRLAQGPTPKSNFLAAIAAGC